VRASSRSWCRCAVNRKIECDELWVYSRPGVRTVNELERGLISPKHELLWGDSVTAVDCDDAWILEPIDLRWTPLPMVPRFVFRGGGRLCRWFSRKFDCHMIKIQELLKTSLGAEFSFRILQPGTRIRTKGRDAYTATRKFLDKTFYCYFTFFPNSEKPKNSDPAPSS
jgi:hypothetical protein